MTSRVHRSKNCNRILHESRPPSQRTQHTQHRVTPIQSPHDIAKARCVIGARPTIGLLPLRFFDLIDLEHVSRAHVAYGHLSKLRA